MPLRTPTENKAATPAGDRCPQCGQRGTQCREVPLGHWCQVEGLLEDKSKWIHPSPDPVAEAMEKEPALIEARLAVDAAQAEFDASHERWLAALSDLAAARISNSRVSFSQDGGPPRRHRRAVKNEEELSERERLVARERDRAHEALVEVSSAHRRLLAETRRRMTEEML